MLDSRSASEDNTLPHLPASDASERTTLTNAMNGEPGLVPDLIMRLDAELRILYVSRSVEVITGIGPGVLTGRPVQVWLPSPETAALWEAGLRRTLQTGRVETLEFLYPTETYTRTLQAYFSTELVNGRPASLFVVIRDVTASRRQELELTRENHALRQELEAARREAPNMSEFLAELGHELRMPLNGALQATEMILKTTLETEQRELAGMIRNYVRTLLALTDNFLDMARMEAGLLQLVSEPLSLASLVEDVVSLFTMQAQAKGLDIIVRFAPDLPEEMEGDSQRLRQVLTNLLDNAVKYTPQGYIFVEVACMERTQDRALIHVDVMDTGVGIASDRLEQIFQRFVQVGAAANRQYQGAGLGLAICRQLAAMMQGTLHAASVEGKGSLFRFAFPLKPRSDQPSRPASNLNGVRTLIVDANPLRQNTLKEMAMQLGARVETRSNMEDMLGALRGGVQGSDPFRLVLLEDRTPGLDWKVWRNATLVLPALLEVRLVALATPGREGEAGIPPEVALAGTLTKPVLPQAFRAMAQTVSFRSAPVMPTKPPSPQPPVAPSQPEPTPRYPVPPTLRALVVEDDEISRRVTQSLLEEMGGQVEIVGRGRDAIERVQRETFDIVFLDYRLPDMDGFRVASEIRQAVGAGKTLPLIAMTAYVLPETRARLLSAGVSDVLEKPLRDEALRRVLASLNLLPETHALPPALDRESLTRRLHGNKELLKSVVALCRAQWPILLREMDRATAQADRAAFLQASHKLRGIMMSLDARAASEAVRQMDDALKVGTAPDVERARQGLGRELERLDRALLQIEQSA